MPSTPTPLPDPDLNEPNSNLALNRPAFGSSSDSTGPTSNAVDGNPSTRWSSAYEDNQWFYVDLGQVYNVERIVLTWGMNAYGRVYDIDVSDNGQEWTTVLSVTDGDGLTDDLRLSASGRYIRMFGYERDTRWGYSFIEFEVYGNNHSEPLPTITPTPTPEPTFPPSFENDVYQHILSRLKGVYLRKNHLYPSLSTEALSDTSWGFDWIIEPGPDNYVLIKNRLNGNNKYLRQYFKSSAVKALPLDPKSWGFHWVVEQNGQYTNLRNRLSGQYLRASFNSEAVFCADLNPSSWGFDWLLEEQ